MCPNFLKNSVSLCPCRAVSVLLRLQVDGVATANSFGCKLPKASSSSLLQLLSTRVSTLGQLEAGYKEEGLLPLEIDRNFDGCRTPHSFSPLSQPKAAN